MRSRPLESALMEFLDAASGRLSADVAAGAEVPFELGSRMGGRGRAPTPLYCYRALTAPFIAEREPALKRLPAYAEAARLLTDFDGLDRYVARAGAASAASAKGRAEVALKVLLEEVFDEQSDFDVRPERLRAALERLEQSQFADAGTVTLVGTLHGLTIASAELALSRGLQLAQPAALRGAPDAALRDEDGRSENHLLVVHTIDGDDLHAALRDGREVLRDLLRALRLFGDGRVTLGALAWVRVGGGAWDTFALGAGGRPHGMLLVTVEQEDELRAFCNLVSRRTPSENELAWALRRFELGCERESWSEALSDHLLALRVLLEPEGPASGLLAGRLAVLCATREQRGALTERIVHALELERTLIAQGIARSRGAQAIAGDVADHLRALLRDVICGHLSPDLALLADELLSNEVDADAQTGSQEALIALETA